MKDIAILLWLCEMQLHVASSQPHSVCTRAGQRTARVCVQCNRGQLHVREPEFSTMRNRGQ